MDLNNENNKLSNMLKKSIYQNWHDRNQDFFDEPALDYLGTKKTFRECDEDIQNYARGFIDLNGTSKESVTFCTRSLPGETLSFFALNKMGIRSNFIGDNHFKLDTKRYVDENESKTLVISDEFYPAVAKELENTNIKNIVFSSIANMAPEYLHDSLGGLNSMDKLINNGVELSKKFEHLTLNDLYKNGKNRSDEVKSEFNPGSVAAHLYTSGSTGDPKGLMYSNEQIARMAKVYDEIDLVDRGDRVWQLIPPNHPTDFVHNKTAVWLRGSEQVFNPKFDPRTFGKDLMEQKIQVYVGAIEQFLFLLQHSLPDGSLNQLKHVFAGGSPSRKTVVRAINNELERLGVQNPFVKNAYGFGEGGPMVTIPRGKPKTAHKAGQPLDNVEIKIVDPKTGKELGINETGEIYVRSDMKMLGYHNMPELTASKYTRDGFYMTGDSGSIDENGELEVSGRLANMITTADGENIPLYNVTEALLELDDKILSMEVIKRNNEEGNEVCVAHFILKPGFEDKGYEVIKDLTIKANETFRCKNAIPIAFKIHEALPSNPNSNKCDYTKLAKENDDYSCYNKESNEIIRFNFLENNSINIIEAVSII